MRYTAVVWQYTAYKPRAYIVRQLFPSLIVCWWIKWIRSHIPIKISNIYIIDIIVSYKMTSPT